MSDDGAGLTPRQAATLAALRDGERPLADGGALSSELLGDLELALLPVVGERDPDDGLVLYKSRLNDVHGCTQRYLDTADEPFEWSVPVVRGKLVHKAIELRPFMAVDAAAGELVGEAAARITDGTDGLGDFVASLSPGERAELEAEATAQLTAFEDGFPPIERGWRPVFEGVLKVHLLGGRAQLYARPDLMLGHVEREGRRTRLIVDHKTGNPHRSHRDDLAFYALVHTLKLSAPPFRVATFYLDSATVDVADVDEALLQAAVRRVADAAVKVVGLASGEIEPTLSPGPPCGWCARRPDCEGAREWEEELERRGI